MKNLGIYVHIPFCVRKCNYCDFLSFECHEKDIEREYTLALTKEITQVLGSLSSKAYSIDTVFIGGGTPSLFQAKSIEQILLSVEKQLPLSGNCEITIESNPNTLDLVKLKDYQSIRINRLSMGVQSLENELLNGLGRIHSQEDFLKNFQEARAAGFDNINADLMFSIPGQTIKTWENTLNKMLELKPEHISFYGLKIEENTVFYQMYKDGLLHENRDVDDREMYYRAVLKLKENGYEHYEISNAARAGKESKHNLKYWSMEEYIGVGLGSHSYINQKRYSNETNLNKYIQNAKAKEQSPMGQVVWSYENSKEDEHSEFVFTGLRKINGISKTTFQQRYGIEITTVYKEVIEKMKLENLIKEDGDNLKLTKIGIDISNYVLSHFV